MRIKAQYKTHAKKQAFEYEDDERDGVNSYLLQVQDMQNKLINIGETLTLFSEMILLFMF